MTRTEIKRWGTAVRCRLTELGWHQVDLARLGTVSDAMISQLLSGNSRSRPLMEKINVALFGTPYGPAILPPKGVKPSK